MHFSFFSVLVLVGVVQGLILCGWIWSGRNAGGKWWLGWMLMAFNLLCIKIVILSSGLWNWGPLRYFPLPFDLAVQPLVYLYVRTAAREGKERGRKDWWHFLPFGLSFIYSAYVYLCVLPLGDLSAKDAMAASLSFGPVKRVEDILSILSAVGYWIAGWRMPVRGWLRQFGVLMGLLILGLTTAILLDVMTRFGARHFIHWQLFFVYMAVLIYYCGFRGVMEPALAGVKPVAKAIDEDEILVRKRAAERIRQAMREEKLYLDPAINLEAAARHLGMSQALVSSVINGEFGESFRGLVNQYRVEAVKEKLSAGASKHLSLLGIAYSCGFNSEASFYRVFKAVTGQSPKEYKDSQNLF